MPTKRPNLRYISDFKVLVIFFLLALVGILIIPKLNIKLNPENSNNNIQIKFYMAGATPRSIENTITSRLEGIIASLNGVIEIQSESNFGEGLITIELDKYARVDIFRMKLNSAIRQTWKSFPEGIGYPVISYGIKNNKENASIMVYRVETNKNIEKINDYIVNDFIPELLKVKGLKEIRTEGLYNIEMHLIINKGKIEELNISTQEILQAIRNYNKQLVLNKIEISNERNIKLYNIKITLNQDTTVDIKNIIVKKIDNKVIKLSEIAKVKRQQSNIYSRYRVNGINNVYLRLFPEEKQNHLKLAKQIKNQLIDQKHNQPDDIKLYLVSDSTEFVKNEIANICYRTLLTLFLLMFAVWIIYRDKNYLFLIGICLIINICISFFIFYILGLDIHFYTLAGITISLGMMIDNSIIVIDYLKKFSENKILLPLFASTLTTIGALYSVHVVPIQKDIFWHDFTLVIIINLSLSFFTSFFLIPSLIDKLPLNSGNSSTYFNKRIIISVNYYFLKYIKWAVKNKRLIIIIFVFGFGIPFFKLPKELNENLWYSKYYNQIFSNSIFVDKIRPIIDKVTGGSFRLFAEDVLDKYKINIPHEKKLDISVISQKEYSFEHLNSQVEKLEFFLIGIDGIKNIQTEITRNKNASINILFKENIEPMLPYILLDKIAIYLKENAGGADWSLSFDDTNIQVKHEIQRNKIWGFYLYGYNFDELIEFAEKTKTQMLLNHKVRNVTIKSKYSLFTSNDHQSQSVFSFNNSLNSINMLVKRDILKTVIEKNKFPIYLGTFNFENSLTKYYLNTNEKENDIFNFMNESNILGDKYSRLNSLGYIKKEDMPLEIVRYNQQYQVFLNFDYIGSGLSARNYEQEQIHLFNSNSPPGFSAGHKFKDSNDNHILWLILILLIVLIIYFITSILFESLKQALWVIIIIPFSYIGVFLVFWLFNVNFDQGGYASLILLGGITVNASIYFINSYNNVKVYKDDYLRYLKAWNRMITPIFITVLSTILGFIPFLIGKSEVFWKALATGTIGGLLFSLFAITAILPIALIKLKHN